MWRSLCQAAPYPARRQFVRSARPVDLWSYRSAVRDSLYVGSGWSECSIVQETQAHTGVTGLGKPVRGCNRLELLSCFDWCNGERQLGGLHANLHIGKAVKVNKQAALITFAPLQFVGNVHHLVKETIEFRALAAEQRLILRYNDTRE